MNRMKGPRSEGWMRHTVVPRGSMLNQPRSAFGPKLRRLRTVIALGSTAAAPCLVEWVM